MKHATFVASVAVALISQSADAQFNYTSAHRRIVAYGDNPVSVSGVRETAQLGEWNETINLSVPLQGTTYPVLAHQDSSLLSQKISLNQGHARSQGNYFLGGGSWPGTYSGYEMDVSFQVMSETSFQFFGTNTCNSWPNSNAGYNVQLSRTDTNQTIFRKYDEAYVYTDDPIHLPGPWYIEGTMTPGVTYRLQIMSYVSTFGPNGQNYINNPAVSTMFAQLSIPGPGTLLVLAGPAALLGRRRR